MLLIGDVHGYFDKYRRLVKKKSIQIGDFGFSDTWTKLYYSDLRPEDHKILGGNHDDYDLMKHSPHALGDFGTYENFYFIRGGYSIDGSVRRLSRKQEGKSWWGNEQLGYAQMRACEDDYLAKRPKVVISHTPPNFIIQKMSSPEIMIEFGYDPDFKCQTSQFLEYLFTLHKPKFWYFGHMHKTFQDMIGGCIFIGLAPLEALDVPIPER